MKLITWLSGLAGCVQVNVILRVRSQISDYCCGTVKGFLLLACQCCTGLHSCT